MPTWIAELQSWWDALPPEWVLLTLLPFVVGATGLLVHRGGPPAPGPQPEPQRVPRLARARKRGRATSQ